MKKPAVVQCAYFRWRMYRHPNGTWWADGRSNSIDVGRKSLMTAEFDEARTVLIKLDVAMAVEFGLADRNAADAASSKPLLLTDGRQRFEHRLEGSTIAGGRSKPTRKRYRTVCDKFLSYANERGVRTWNAVSTGLVRDYGQHLEVSGYAPKTVYLELSVVKQIVNDLKRHGELPAAHAKIDFPLKVPKVNSTYCYSLQDVADIRDFCSADTTLGWLYDLTTLLSHTGLRIGEASQLLRSDVTITDKGAVLEILDDRGSKNSTGRTTKNKKSRRIPIHAELRPVIDRRVAAQQGGFLFCGPRGGKIKPDTARRILQRDVLEPLSADRPQRAGEMSLRDGRLHSFRHFFCSQCANNGVPIHTLMTWLGHSDSDMVRHYYSLSDEFSQEAIAKLSLSANGKPTN